jgi:hypothetical protein
MLLDVKPHNREDNIEPEQEDEWDMRKGEIKPKSSGDAE